MGQINPSSLEAALAHDLSNVDKLFINALGHGKEISISLKSSKWRRTEDKVDFGIFEADKKVNINYACLTFAYLLWHNTTATNI